MSGKPAARLGDIGSGHGCHFVPSPSIAGSPNVIINNKPATRQDDAFAPHPCPVCPIPPHPRKLAAGSPTVLFNNKQAGRIGDPIDCGGVAAAGSPNVLIGAVSPPPTHAPFCEECEKARHIQGTSSSSNQSVLQAPSLRSKLTLPSKPGTLTPTEAQEFFDEMRSTDIPFDYKPDCCYARAHEMAHILEDRGIKTSKVWYYASPGDNLTPYSEAGEVVRFPSDDGKPISWWYHVAPMVTVCDPITGVCEEKIMDPSMTEGPVSEVEWKNLMGPPKSRITQKTKSDVFWTGGPGAGGQIYDTDHQKTEEAFSNHRKRRDAVLGK